MEVVDVSNCLFTECVARFCFFTGTEGAGVMETAANCLVMVR